MAEDDDAGFVASLDYRLRRMTIETLLVMANGAESVANDPKRGAADWRAHLVALIGAIRDFAEQQSGGQTK